MIHDWDKNEGAFLDELQRQYPSEEIGWCGPGTWALLAQCHPGYSEHLPSDECGFMWFNLDGTKVFMNAFAKEGEITFNGDSLSITGLAFVSL